VGRSLSAIEWRTTPYFERLFIPDSYANRDNWTTVTKTSVFGQLCLTTFYQDQDAGNTTGRRDLSSRVKRWLGSVLAVRD
jgi:hypothetical protein